MSLSPDKKGMSDSEMSIGMRIHDKETQYYITYIENLYCSLRV